MSRVLQLQFVKLTRLAPKEKCAGPVFSECWCASVASHAQNCMEMLKIRWKIRIIRLIWGNLGTLRAISWIFQVSLEQDARFLCIEALVSFFKLLFFFFTHIWLLQSVQRSETNTGEDKRRTEKRSYLRPAEVNGEPEYKPKTCQVPVPWFSNTTKAEFVKSVLCPSGYKLCFLTMN